MRFATMLTFVGMHVLMGHFYQVTCQIAVCYGWYSLVCAASETFG
eukprot:gene13067-8913_t